MRKASTTPNEQAEKQITREVKNVRALLRLAVDRLEEDIAALDDVRGFVCQDVQALLLSAHTASARIGTLKRVTENFTLIRDDPNSAAK